VVGIGFVAVVSAAFVVLPAVAQQAKPGGSAPAQDQTKPATPLRPAPTPAARLDNAKEVLATVNGDPITRSDVIEYLTHYAVPIGKEQEGYDMAIEQWVNVKLLNQFLKTQRVAFDAKEIDRQVGELEKNLKANNHSLPEYLAEQGITLDQLKTRQGQVMQWQNFLRERATDAELEKYFKNNKDLFDGKMVRASHILIKVAQNASEAEKEAAHQKLVSIRKEIESGKISFADAANKYSDDQDETKNGGDLDYFPRRGKFDEAFADTAFALSKGQISQPIFLPEFGWELIQVTDIRPGVAVDFKQIKPRVVSMYGYQLQESIIDAQRKTAKIDIKPLPKDLYPKVSAEDLKAQQGGLAGASGAAAAAKGAAPKR
jgi:parvulin-like peptidyl-prolyl isomerase